MRGKIRSILFLLLFAMFLPPLLGVGVWQTLQHRLGIRVGGVYCPSILVPSFTIRGAHFEWDDKVKLVSGNIKVGYHPVSYLVRNFLLTRSAPLRTRLSGRNLDIELLGNWSQMQGLHRVKLDLFEADLVFGPSGIQEIYLLRAESPQFQFHIEKSETLIPVRSTEGRDQRAA